MIHTLYRVLWYANPIFDILLLFVLFARRRAASFPFFTLCTITDLAEWSILLYLSSHHMHQLFHKLVWPLGLVQESVTLLVAWELSMHVFRPTGVWAADVRRPLLCIAGGAIVVAFLFSLLSHPPFRPHTMMMWRIDLFYCILETVLFAGLLILSSMVGLPWSTHAARIAQVMCAGCLCSLLAQIVNMSVSLKRLNQIYVPLMCIDMILGLAGVVYWLFTLWRDEPARQPLPDHMHKQIYTLQQQVENDLTTIRSWRSS